MGCCTKGRQPRALSLGAHYPIADGRTKLASPGSPLSAGLTSTLARLPRRKTWLSLPVYLVT